MSLDLIVANYRTPIDLNHFLSSLHKNPPTVPWSLTIVNVDPDEEDDAVAQRWMMRLHARVRYVTFEENVGYARAVNNAARTATHDILAIFNADTRLTQGTADACHDALDANDEWAILGPRQVDDTGLITAAGIFGTLEHRQDRAFHHRNSAQYGDIRDDAVSVSGSAYFIKTNVWNELTNCPDYRAAAPAAEGAFLPTPHYYEETYCSYHAITHGYKVAYYGAATMIHRWHQASPRGGWAERQIPTSKALFRAACDIHGIPHE